jgi:hypothetical protein
MFILSQDKDTIFTLCDRGLFKGTIYSKDIYINGRYYGANIYGKTLFSKCLLGTYEEDEPEMVISEIYTLLKAGEKYYTMPAPSIDLEDLGVAL